MSHIGRSNRRRLACGPNNNTKVIAHLPALFTETDKHGNPMTVDQRRFKMPLPDWASPAAGLRPTTNEFAVASDNIATINYKAYARSKRIQHVQDKGWKHWKSTVPRRIKPMYHPLHGSKPLNKLPKQHQSSAPTIKFKTSWLEPVVDENVLDAQFEEHLQKHIPEVRILLRTTRKKQKDWENNLDEHRENLGVKANRNKPQLWIPRNNPNVKIPKVQNWLERHGQTLVSNKVKQETSDAIKNNPKHIKRKNRKKKTKTKHLQKKPHNKKSHFLGSGSSMKETGWFEEKKISQHEKILLHRLKLLEKKHHLEKPVHSKRWYSNTANQLVPTSYVPVESSGIISGGRRFISANKNNTNTFIKQKQTRKRRGSPLARSSNATSYRSPLLLDHEK